MVILRSRIFRQVTYVCFYNYIYSWWKEKIFKRFEGFRCVKFKRAGGAVVDRLPSHICIYFSDHIFQVKCPTLGYQQPGANYIGNAQNYPWELRVLVHPLQMDPCIFCTVYICLYNRIFFLGDMYIRGRSMLYNRACTLNRPTSYQYCSGCGKERRI